jgi:SAM-dependent methyltransferase
MDPDRVGGGATVTGPAVDLYQMRFDEREISTKQVVWEEIALYLRRYFDAGAPLLDIGCDRGHFVNAVGGLERWAADTRDVKSSLDSDVHFVQATGLNLLEHLPPSHFGTIFMSNYLEHLKSSDEVIEQLRVVSALLRPGGRVIVLQPNIRLVGSRYWDFIDHRVALTERSLLEAAELAHIGTVELVTRFLPYSTKGRLPARRALVKLYLRTKPAWWLLGKQTLFVGERPR